MQRLFNRKRNLGQALVEFSLILPTLLLALLIIVDYGRSVFIFAVASSSIREAARQALISGEANDERYADCEFIIREAGDLLVGEADQIEVLYYNTTNPANTPFLEPSDLDADGEIQEPGTAEGAPLFRCIAANPTTYNSPSSPARPDAISNPSTGVRTGDILRIEMRIIVRHITPIANRFVDQTIIDVHTQRTLRLFSLVEGVAGDTDIDGLPDEWEEQNFGFTNFDPNRTPLCYFDESGVQLTGNEIIHFTAIDDPDGDGCLNGCERVNGTDPCRADTDGDGLDDGDEVNVYFTNPTLIDTDGDDVTDFLEVFPSHTYGPTNPNDPDTDEEGGLQDGLDDGQEQEDLGLEQRNCNPNSLDTDADGILDGIEELPSPATYSPPDGINGSAASWSVATDCELNDTDRDGLSDPEERITPPGLPPCPRETAGPGDPLGRGCTDPNNPDTDGDGLPDNAEINGDYSNVAILMDAYPTLFPRLQLLVDTVDVTTLPRTNPFHADVDGDNLPDFDEFLGGADPTDPNTDNTFTDSLILDGDGFNNLPFQFISTEDGSTINTGLIFSCTLDDFAEVVEYGTDPADLDTDDDGLSDCAEQFLLDSSPTLFDTDDDGLSDRRELSLGTDPTNPDTDGDGISDGDEVANGTNPLDPTNSGGTNNDTDNDNLPDFWEIDYFGDLDEGPNGDPDSDGCNNLCELFNGTDPTDPDTDGDGLGDNDERPETDPTKADTDDDGLEDGIEVNPQPGDLCPDGSTISTAFTTPSNPRSPFSDDDFLTDYQEACPTAAHGAWATQFPRGDELYNPTLPEPITLSLDSTDVTTVRGSDPNNNDTDGDGVLDHFEAFPSAPRVRDTDGTLDGTGTVQSYNPYDPNQETAGYGLGSHYIPYPEELPDDIIFANPSRTYSAQHRFLATDPNNANSDETTSPQRASDFLDGGGPALADGQLSSIPYATIVPEDGTQWNDFVEIYQRRSNPNAADTDGDNLRDEIEFETGTIFDGQQRFIGGQNVNSADTDNDGLTDGEEYWGVEFNPATGAFIAELQFQRICPTGVNGPVLDVPGFVERDQSNTTIELNPERSDSDGDGLTDGEEYDGITYTISATGTTRTNVQTNPVDFDTDDDDPDFQGNSFQYSDGQEIDPAINESSPGAGDGVTDPLCPTGDVSEGDFDNDGLTNSEEQIGAFVDADRGYDTVVAFRSTLSDLNDTDGDGLLDGAEVYGFNDATYDETVDTNTLGYDFTYSYREPDGTLNSNVTVQLFLDPQDADMDDDGLPDGAEVLGDYTGTPFAELYPNPGDGFLTDPRRAAITEFDRTSEDTDNFPQAGDGWDTDGDGIGDGSELLYELILEGSAANGYLNGATATVDALNPTNGEATQDRYQNVLSNTVEAVMLVYWDETRPNRASDASDVATAFAIFDSLDRIQVTVTTTPGADISDILAYNADGRTLVDDYVEVSQVGDSYEGAFTLQLISLLIFDDRIVSISE